MDLTAEAFEVTKRGKSTRSANEIEVSLTHTGCQVASCFFFQKGTWRGTVIAVAAFGSAPALRGSLPLPPLGCHVGDAGP